jgi:hypothetical protein
VILVSDVVGVKTFGRANEKNPRRCIQESARVLSVTFA